MAKKIEPKVCKEHKPRRLMWFRSILDLGSFCDNEVNNEPSLTDPTQDEPIHKIVERLCRGEAVGAVQPVYDSTDPAATPEQLFAAQPPVERDGFDLADVPAILEAGAAAVAALKEGGTKVPPAPEKPQEGAVPAEKKGDESPKPAEKPV